MVEMQKLFFFQEKIVYLCLEKSIKDVQNKTVYHLFHFNDLYSSR
jgi:hypothetical protein